MNCYNNNGDLGRWFAAGLFSGINRYLQNDRDDYFSQLANNLVEEGGEPMKMVLTAMSEYYNTLSLNDRSQFTGRYAMLDIKGDQCLWEMPRFYDMYNATGILGGRLVQITEETQVLVSATGGTLRKLPQGLEKTKLPKKEKKGKGEDEGDDPRDTPKPKVYGEEIDESKCCEQLIISLERIHIKDDTDGIGKDDVRVDGLITGKMLTTPNMYFWPRDSDGKPTYYEMATGDMRQPRDVIARVEPYTPCRIDLHVILKFWETDNDRLEDAIRKTTRELANQVGVAASKVGLPPSSQSLLNSIIDSVLELLGLSDDNMGQFDFEVHTKFHPGIDVTQFGWVPAWGTNAAGISHDKIGPNTARLKKTFSSHGGTWEAFILVDRVCNV